MTLYSIFHIILLGDSATRPQQVSTGSLRVTIISQEGQSKQEDFDTVRLYWWTCIFEIIL